MVNEAIHLLEAIGRPQDGLYETLTRTLQRGVFSQRSAKAIAAIAANEPEWIASRNVVEEFEQVLEETKSQFRLRSIIESLGILGENCLATTDIGRIVDLLFAATEEYGFQTAPAAAGTINSLFSNAPDIVEQPDVDITGLEIGLDPSQDYDVKVRLTSAIVSISEYHPEYLVDTPIISPLIDGLEKLERTVLRDVTDAVGLIGRTHADVVSEAVEPLIANADKYGKSSTMMSPNLQIASLRALSRIAEGSPTVVVDVSDKIVDHLSGSLYATRIYAAVVILHFNSNSNIDVEEELVNESLDALKAISDLPADERDRAIKMVAKLSDENAEQLAPIRENLDSIHHSVGGNAAKHIEQILEQMPTSSA